MSERIVQLTESSLGRKLIPDAPVYPVVLDKSVLVMDNEDNKYVPLDTLDLVGFIKLSEYFSKFIPFNDYVTGSLTVEEVYSGGATGTVVYSSSKNAMLLRVPAQDEVIGSVVKYYYNWNDVDSILGYSSKEYNDNHTIKTQRFFYTTTGALVIYKYDPTMRVLVPTAGGGSEIDPAYIEQIVENIFESYINTAAHIKPLAYWVDENDELPNFASVPIDSYAYHVGHGLYTKYDDSVDWDTVESDTIDQFFYYDNSLYKWDGSELQGVIDTESMLVSLRNTVTQYIGTICTWKPISTYEELPVFNFPDDIYAYCDNKVWHSENGEWVRQTSNGLTNIDGQMFYDDRHIYQFVNNTLRVLFNFNSLLSDITSQYIGTLLQSNLKTINNTSIWINQGDNSNIEVLSPEYLNSWINNDEFDASSEVPASQRTIAMFVSEFIDNNRGSIIMPYYCCTQSQLPSSPAVDVAWYDTANNKLFRTTQGGFQNFMGVNNAGLVFVKKTMSGTTTYDVVLYVQTGVSSNVAISLTKGNDSSNTASIPFYTPVGWDNNRPPSGSPAGSAYFNTAECRLYISSDVDIWGVAPEGDYLLHKPSTTEFYMFYQPSGGSGGVLTPLTVADNKLSITSKNAVQNKVITPLINDLLNWKGRIILLDGEGITAPDTFNYWYDPVNKILECKASGEIEGFYEGVYVLISADRSKIYVYNADLRSDVQLATAGEIGLLESMVNNRATQGYVIDAVDKAVGKVVSVRLMAPSGQYTLINNWQDGEYYFDSTTNKLWKMWHDNLPKNEIGSAGEAYILIDRSYSPPSFYAWNVGTRPILLLTQSQGDSYANKTQFESWKSRVIAVDYWGGDTPQNPTANQIWYNPSPKTLKYYNDGWNDYLPSFAATSTYMLLNKNDNCLYVAPNNGSLLRYPIHALEDIYLNGTLVSSRDIDGKRAVELNIDPSLYDATVNKGEVISPYWGTLTGEEELLEGDYNLDDNNDLYKYVYVDDALDWVQIMSGSFILRKEESSSEYLYSYTVGSEPIKLATYNDISGLGGGTITGIKNASTSSLLQPDVNGVVTLPYFVESSALGNYATRAELGSLTGQISDLNLQNRSVRLHGKAVCIAEEVTPSGISSSTYNVYASGDELSFVMSNNGEFLLRVVNGGTTTYYREWSRIVNIQFSIYLQPSSDFTHDDLYFLQDADNLIFWVWNGSKYAKTVNFSDIVNKVNRAELSSLPKVIALRELLQGSSGGIWTSDNIDQYRIKNANSSPVLEKYNGSTFDTISDENLYILYYNRRLYYFKNSITLGRAELVSFPNSADYNTLQASIPSKIIEVLHFGPTNGISDGIEYAEGEIWYDNTEDNEHFEYFDGEQFQTYTLNTNAPVFIYNREESKGYVYFGDGDMRGIAASTSNTGGNSSAIVIKYWQVGDEFDTSPSEGDYWYDKDGIQKLQVYNNGTWRTDLINTEALYISPKPDDIADVSQQGYGNALYRWDGSDLIALSNDDELTSALTELAEDLWQQSASLSNIVATAGQQLPENAVVGQCYFHTGDGKPYWYAGQATGWVDANGDPYNS